MLASTWGVAPGFYKPGRWPDQGLQAAEHGRKIDSIFSVKKNNDF
jgi:hypothetical protein